MIATELFTMPLTLFDEIDCTRPCVPRIMCTTSVIGPSLLPGNGTRLIICRMPPHICLAMEELIAKRLIRSVSRTQAASNAALLVAACSNISRDGTTVIDVIASDSHIENRSCSV